MRGRALVRRGFMWLAKSLVGLGSISLVLYAGFAIWSESSATRDLRLIINPAAMAYLQAGWLALPAGLLLGTILSKNHRTYWGLGLLASPFILVVGVFVQLFTQTPELRNYARVVDGRTFLLAQFPTIQDDAWGIWRPHDRHGVVWALETDQMTYSEDGRFTSNAMLVASRDGRRLLVQRGGIWTDCFDVKAELEYCDVQDLNWDAAFLNPKLWVDHSNAIAELAGMPAGAPNPGRPY
jgi:hypothetical protein